MLLQYNIIDLMKQYKQSICIYQEISKVKPMISALYIESI